ncbi:hypothetical protein AY599_14770 [Leptolyngbya valderiana BDU 20041]|nr:hypothetical protein [Geitlerinema sp. CS-897]OAB61599.1 hypothetical protein AY599_14770 [Leptolyngbya valderiana BDU 20041]
MLKKLFGSKKEEFFVEIEDTQGAKTDDAPDRPAAPEAKEEKPEKTVKSEKKAKPAAKKAEKKAEKKTAAPKAKKAAKPAPAPQPKAKPAAAQKPVETGFATRYLMPNSATPRRRPSANMKDFLNMAKETNSGR